MTPFDDASFVQLRDRAWLENAICQMGLAHNPNIFPEHLHPFMGGARIWQYPCQLAPYLIYLSDKKIRSYCEIGVAYGGTLAVTVAYLNRFTPLDQILVIDDNSMRLGDDALKVIETLPAPVRVVWDRSDSSAAHEAIEEIVPDLVLIDACHTGPACLSDYNMVRDVARFVAFHDIVEWSTPDVTTIWAGVDGQKTEFVEQYSMRRSFFGIGVVG